MPRSPESGLRKFSDGESLRRARLTPGLRKLRNQLAHVSCAIAQARLRQAAASITRTAAPSGMPTMLAEVWQSASGWAASLALSQQRAAARRALRAEQPVTRTSGDQSARAAGARRWHADYEGVRRPTASSSGRCHSPRTWAGGSPPGWRAEQPAGRGMRPAPLPASTARHVRFSAASAAARQLLLRRSRCSHAHSRPGARRAAHS